MVKSHVSVTHFELEEWCSSFHKPPKSDFFITEKFHNHISQHIKGTRRKRFKNKDALTCYIYSNESLTLHLIEMPFNGFANRADPDQAALVRAA